MTHTETFIRDSLEGGWREKEGFTDMESHSLRDGTHLYLLYGKAHRRERFIAPEEALLDPLAWQACGKVRGWTLQSDTPEHWRKMMHTFIDHLCDGLTIEDSLAAIAK